MPNHFIPRIDAEKLASHDPATLAEIKRGASDVGFLTLYNTDISSDDVKKVIASYQDFFALPTTEKDKVNMAKTSASRGWGASSSEQVNPSANPDYKQVFDCGFELPETDPFYNDNLAVYAANLWPTQPNNMQTILSNYYEKACQTSKKLLSAIAFATGQNEAFFQDKFTRPMALLRGNYYPNRPNWAGPNDFGIAAHTDYGCLTLLATDGSPGLEVCKREGDWIPLSAPPGEFIINFGEMLELWTEGQIKATPHRVQGTSHERISVPLFFNPNHDTNVASKKSDHQIIAGEYLTQRYAETYVHLQS